jgi:parvulin-like peptidyl-prolyl isomerase
MPGVTTLPMADFRLPIGILTLVTALGGGARAEIIDRVLAVVSGAVIMQSDVLGAFELGMVAPGTTDDPMAAVLSQLIDRQLMLAEVDRYVPPEPSADAIDRAAQQVRARFATASEYDSALARSGMGEERLRRLLRDELRIRAYLDERFIVPPPGDDELGQYYRDHLGTFTRDGQVVPFDAARAEIAAAVATTRRAALISDWVRGLRRRAEISNLYLVRR